MKSIVSVVLFLCACGVQAQHVPNASSKDFNFLMRKSENILGFACYYGGMPTENVASFSKLIDKHYYDDIKILLTSEIPANKVLAVVIVEELVDKKQLKLTEEDMAVLKSCYSSTEEFNICSGCTVNLTLEVGAFLRNDNTDYFLTQFKRETNEWVQRELWH
jgi:hypothetical protein